MKSLPVFLFIIALRASALWGQTTTGIYINEVMSSNSGTIADATGDYADWIELYNTNPFNVDLAGYYMTDNLNSPTKFRFTTTAGQVVLPANGYLLIWASEVPARGSNHLSFGLSSSGEKAGLYAPNGVTIVDTMSFPALRSDVSIGRLPNGNAAFTFFSPASPNASNNAAHGYEAILPPPSFSATRGFFSAPFSLTLTTSVPGATIVYTTDGSEPNPDHLLPQTYQYKNQYPKNPGDPVGSFLTKQFQSFNYTAPVSIIDKAPLPNKISGISSTFDVSAGYLPTSPIYKGTVVRARVFKAGSLPSEIVTHTYFFTPNGQKKYTLPIVSITSPEKGLFGYYDGIYVAGADFDNWRASHPTEQFTEGGDANYKRTGDPAERPGHFELFENNGTKYSQNIGIRMHGGFSRSFRFKSMRIYSRGKYGSNEFGYKIFPNLPYTSYQTFILRNSGNDYQYTLFRDAVLQESVGHLRFDIQAYRPSLVFLNGEYWGIHNFRQRLDKDYYAQKYKLDADNLDVLETSIGMLNVVSEGDVSDYQSMTDYITTNGVQSQTHYDYIKTRMDVDNFMDYQISEIYFNNTDWPQNNIQYWRLRVPYTPNAPYGQDGRWRWSMFDLDLALANLTWGDDKLASASVANSSYTLLLNKLLQNTTFKNEFINRFADLLNTAFLPNRLISMINQKRDGIAAEITDHTGRWRMPSNYNAWLDAIVPRVTFVQERPSIQRSHIRNKFGISTDRDLTVNVSDTAAGYVRVNTIDILPTTPGVSANAYPWTGKYFNGISLKIRGVAKLGYRFKHWTQGANVYTDSVLTITPTSNLQYTAVFEEACFANETQVAYALNDCGYAVREWSASAPGGTFPPSMAFVYMNALDPGLSATIAGVTSGVYNLGSRTRINGLGNKGIAFINTGNTDGNPGYPGVKLGGALLALNTVGQTGVSVKWTGRTVTANPGKYRIRLQYRTCNNQSFQNVLDGNGQPVEYAGSTVTGDSAVIGPVVLPAGMLNKPYVQLLWRYYYTGVDDGARDQLAIDDIVVSTYKTLTGTSPAGTSTQQSGNIQSTGVIPATSNVLYQARQSVELKAGFRTETGSIFRAQIQGCP